MDTKSQFSQLRRQRKKFSPSEFDHHVALWQWIQHVGMRKYPELEACYHIPNGEHRHIAVGAKLKQMGVRPGIPDWHFPFAHKGFHSLYLELKREGGRTSKEQDVVIERLVMLGNCVRIAEGWDTARKIIEWYCGADGN